jgi:hypothetical protein
MRDRQPNIRPAVPLPRCASASPLLPLPHSTPAPTPPSFTAARTKTHHATQILQIEPTAGSSCFTPLPPAYSRLGGPPPRPPREYCKTKPRVILPYPPKRARTCQNLPHPAETRHAISQFAKRSHGARPRLGVLAAQIRKTKPRVILSHPPKRAKPFQTVPKRPITAPPQNEATRHYGSLPTAYSLPPTTSKKQNRESLAFRQTIPDLPRAT